MIFIFSMLKTYGKCFLVLNGFYQQLLFLFYFFMCIFNFLIIIILNHKKRVDIVTRTIIKMVPKHLFSPFTWYLREGGIKNKWTTELPGNIQNYNVQAFLSSKRSTDFGPHILHAQLPLAPALIFLYFTYTRTWLFFL